MKKQFTNLDKVVANLNAPTTYEDGETVNSQFKFKYRVYDNAIDLYDSNENYNINYLDEVNSLTRMCAREFGFDYIPQTEDDIMEQLLDAVKKDFGKDAFIEWENSVVMNIVF